MSQENQDIKKFEKEFYKVLNLNNVEKLKEFLLTSSFPTYTQKFKQSVMDHLVCSGYQNEKVAKWALTNTVAGVKGDIHENADRPLRLAAAHNVEFAKYLLTSPELETKANINATNDGSSALLAAIQQNNLDFVRYLITSPELKKKASLRAGKKEFDDALCKACDNNHTEIIKYLLSPECYPYPKKLDAKKNLKRFDFTALKSVIRHNNVEIFKFIQSQGLLDKAVLKENLHDWFCSAVVSDARNIATYLEGLFDQKPDLFSIKHRGESLFFSIVKSNHYSRCSNHSYFDEMVEKASTMITPEELKEMSHFYVYDTNKNKSQPLMEILEVYFEKNKISSMLSAADHKSLKKEKQKI